MIEKINNNRMKLPGECVRAAEEASVSGQSPHARNFQAKGPAVDYTLKSCKRTHLLKRQRSNGVRAGISQAKKRRHRLHFILYSVSQPYIKHRAAYFFGLPKDERR